MVHTLSQTFYRCLLSKLEVGLPQAHNAAFCQLRRKMVVCTTFLGASRSISLQSDPGNVLWARDQGIGHSDGTYFASLGAPNRDLFYDHRSDCDPSY